MTILDEIISYKRKEVASCKELISTAELEQMVLFQRPVLSMKESVQQKGPNAIIAEFKRQSPSKGVINNKVMVEEVTLAYSQGGAAAISVLTDFNFFGGSIEDLVAARQQVNIPLLRKEFIVDEYQLIEAKAFGADAILLIAAVLSAEEIKSLYAVSKMLGLEVLLEMHDEEELDKINGNADLVGINNRNLKTFEVSIENSIRLASLLPANMPKIAESGIHSVDTIRLLQKNGFDGFLIGENFMKTENPGLAFQTFMQQLRA